MIQNTPKEKAVLNCYNSMPLWAQEGLLLWGSRGENRPKKWVQITGEKTNFFLNSTGLSRRIVGELELEIRIFE